MSSTEYMNIEDLRALVEKAKSGDSGAFSTIYSTYYTPLYRYIYFRVKSREEAEDLTQNVFMKIFATIQNFKTEDSSPASYFFTAARNAVIDHYRKRDHTPIASDEMVTLKADETIDESQSFEREEMSTLIRESLTILSPDQYEIMTLKFINELSNSEIAKLTGKSEVAIRQIQSRSLKILRDHFEKNGLLS